MYKLLTSLILTGMLLMIGASPGHAQATRTWVSGVGNDANPCSRTAPCKTFAGAISKTAANGEISVLDPGGFGAVTITKSININASGIEGGVLVSGTNAIIINAGDTGVVKLTGLVIEGIGTGLAGVKVLTAKSVNISNTIIRNFLAATSWGIDVESTSLTRVVVTDSILHNNTGEILVKPSGSGKTNVILDRVTLDGNSTGFSGSTGFGIRADGATASISIAHSTVTGHNTAMGAVNGASIVSHSSNVFTGNQNNGTPTSTVPLQ